MKRALITGITGQDGRYLSQLLASKGYQVFGLIRGQANPKAQLVLDENPGVELVDGDLRDLSSLIAVMEQVQPDEVYNLGAISFVQLSFKQAELTAEITGLGVLRMLEAVRIVGGVHEQPDPLLPGVVVGDVRQGARDPADGAHAVPPSFAVRRREGVRSRHDGELPRVLRPPREQRHPLQPRERAARPRVRHPQDHQLAGADQARAAGQHQPRQPRLRRDWGYAGDYVEAMWMMLQQPEPDDYVIATGETHTIREFLDVAFSIAGYDSWEPYVTHDTRFDRPAEVDLLLGDATKAKEKLGWTRKVSFEELVRRMYEADLKEEQAQLDSGRR